MVILKRNIDNMEENKKFFDLTKENYNYMVSLLSDDLKDRMKK